MPSPDLPATVPFKHQGQFEGDTDDHPKYQSHRGRKKEPQEKKGTVAEEHMRYDGEVEQ